MRQKNKLLGSSLIIILLLGISTLVFGDETKWMAIGSLHNWYSSAGCEQEVGRTHLVGDQQDGLRWPAQFKYQDCQAAKALWIGTTNYNDPIAGKTFNYKVVHVGPRVLDEENEFMPVELKLIGRFNHPLVYVDGVPASKLDYLDFVDEVDEELVADRLLYNVFNTGIGITGTRKIYAFSQQNHDNYFIYDYVFKNTGIIDKKGTINTQTLEGVIFFFQYRYSPGREGGPYGYYWLPQNTSWGMSTMNDAIFTNPKTSDPFRCQFTWLGRHSGAAFDIIGGPNGAPGGDGRLGGAQYVGIFTLHADKSATEKIDDLNQPYTTKTIDSNDNLTYNNSQFNDALMASEYQFMISGRPEKTQAQIVGDGFADSAPGNVAGPSQTQGFGPYTLAPGDSIHIVLAEGVAGLRRDSCYSIGAKWLSIWKNCNFCN